MLGKIVQRAISQVKPNQKNLTNDSLTNQQAQNLQNNQQGVNQGNQAQTTTIKDTKINGNNNKVNIIITSNSSAEQIAEAIKASDKNHIEVANQTELDFDKKYPRDVAKLFITQEQDQCRVSCFNASQEKPLVKYVPHDSLSFSQYIQGNNNLERKNKMREFSGRMRQLSEGNREVQEICFWLINLQKSLEQEHQQKLQYVLIHDETDFEIPWELLRLENNYLGASLVTIRWQNIQNPDSLEPPHIELKFDIFNCRGDIVAYINTTELKGAIQEKNTIEKFKCQPFEDVKKFLYHLETVNSISLIFIASHGFHSDEQIEFGQIENSNGNQRISLTYLHNYDFNCFKENPSLVFMNACHSGRLQRDNKLKIISKEYRTGFATFFLKRGARGFIGTLYKVLDEYAAQVTELFFNEYIKNPELTVPEILRNIRHKVAADCQKDRNENNELLFVSTFMYVYYGNPMTTLQLTQNGEQPHV